MTTHQLDKAPNPTPDFDVNEPDLLDSNIFCRNEEGTDTEESIWIYVPLELGTDNIMHRLRTIRRKYEFIDWRNEFFCSHEVDKVIIQLEIYDQIWARRESSLGKRNGHSQRGIALAKSILSFLEDWEITEDFPCMLIKELRNEYQI